MEQPVVLIPVRPDEGAEFLGWAERHFREVNPQFEPQEDWRRCFFANICANPEMFLCWIVVGGERAGFFLFGLEPHRFLPRKSGTLYELYIAPAHRRKGIARAAAMLAVQELQRFSPSKIQLEIMAGDPGAAALWNSIGFQKVNERYVLKVKP